MDVRLQNFSTKMQSVKHLYHSRHYTRCAKYAEQLLAMTNEKQIHPIHLTYLHFYTALSHDTLAREATLKNRHKELSLAEKHYLAAIAALTPPPGPRKPEEDEQNDSPISPIFPESHLWKRRSSNAGSFDSTTSAASSVTSYGCGRDDEESDEAHKRRESFQFPRPPSVHDHLNSEPRTTRHHNTIYISSYTPSRLASYTTTHAYQTDTIPSNHDNSYNHNTYNDIPTHNPLASQVSSFLTLLHAHLTSVRSLKNKTSVHAVRFAFPSPKPSPPTTRVVTPRERARTSHAYDGPEADNIRLMRRNRVFRERFDPEGVRRLCGDVLAELV